MPTAIAKVGLSALCAVSAMSIMSGVAGAATLKVMLTGRANNSLFNKVIQEYQKSHRSTKITPIYMEWQDQAAALAQKPDVYIGESYFLSDNVDIGIFEELDKLVPARAVKEFLPELLNSCSLGKKLYGVPVFGYANCLVYNRGMFKDAGVAPPDSTWTWQGKFYEACRKLSRTSGDGTSSRFGIVGLPSQNFASLVYSFGGSFHDRALKKVMYTEKPAMDAINFILKLHQEKSAELVDWNSIDQENPKAYPFNNGRSAMEISWNYNLDMAQYNQWYKQQKMPIVAGLAPMPKGPKGSIPAVASEVATMMTTCKNKREATEFLRFMADVKGQKLLYDVGSGLPTTEAGLRLAKVAKSVPSPFLKSYRAGRARSIRRQSWQVENQLWGDLRNVVAGDGTMKDLIDNAKGPAAEALAQL